ncbi:hypothetical protein HRbin10_01755 [bacterium HR10]|nr:hypothetical protein HRbin10_01755 [bacterium HR10]
MNDARPTFRFLRPEVLAKIASLELLARTVVEGFLAGLHRSPRTGFSMDFAEYRPYMPGDDLRYLDWKVLARTDRTYIKKFRGDTNTRVYVLLDVSASMTYRWAPQAISRSPGDPGRLPPAIEKREYACYLAASLAYLATRQNDAVGLITFDRGIVDSIPARLRPGQLHRILSALERMKPGGISAISEALRRIAERLRRRSLVVLLSDLYEPPETLGPALRLLRAHGQDLIVFQILDESEVEFPFTEAARFVDIETGEDVPVAPEALRASYREAVRRHLDEIEGFCRAHGIGYQRMFTTQPLDEALFAYLGRRARWP